VQLKGLLPRSSVAPSISNWSLVTTGRSSSLKLLAMSRRTGSTPSGAPLFINDATNRFYLGFPPGGGPLNTPGTIVPFSNSQNRVESVSFPASVGTGTPSSEKAEKGTYLAICNVRQHFLDGMFAFVKVH
jgi:hypothetical protein